MFINSTINPLSKSDGNIAVGVYRYNDRRKFLRVPESYEEMLSVIIRAFGIEPGSSLSLHTSSLDACRGQAVEIDESAYPLMSSFLDDVEVLVSRPSHAQERKVEKQNAVPAPAPQAEASSSSDADPQSALPRDNSAGVEDAEEGYTAINAYERDREVYESRIGEDDEELDRERISRALFPDHDPASQGRTTTRTSAFKPSRPSPTDTSDVFARTSANPPPPVLHVKTDRMPAPAKQSRPVNESRSLKTPGPRKEAGGVFDADQRFEISITGPDSTQTVQFKTRGKHTVGKVLAAACKTFNVDFKRSRLYCTLLIDDEQGMEERVEVKCEVDETMAQAGITSNSELYIKTDRREEEEEEEEDDDLTNFD